MVLALAMEGVLMMALVFAILQVRDGVMVLAMEMVIIVNLLAMEMVLALALVRGGVMVWAKEMAQAMGYKIKNNNYYIGYEGGCGDITGSGYGSGYGDGDGSGYGSSLGHGYGFGEGNGY